MAGKKLSQLADSEYSLLYVLGSRDKSGNSSCYIFSHFNQLVEYRFIGFDVQQNSPLEIKEGSSIIKGKVNCSYAESSDHLLIGLQAEDENPNLIDLVSGKSQRIQDKIGKNYSITGIDKIVRNQKVIPILASKESYIIPLINNKRPISFKGSYNLKSIESLVSDNKNTYFLAFCSDRIPEYRLFRINDSIKQVGKITHFVSGKVNPDIKDCGGFFLTDASGNQMSILVKNRYNPSLFEYQRINRSVREGCIYNSFEVIPSGEEKFLRYLASYTDKEGRSYLEFAKINLDDQRFNEFMEVKIPPYLLGIADHLKIIYNQALQKKLKKLQKN